MKKIILTFFGLFFLVIGAVVFFLSTTGYETDRFNNLISKKIKDTEKNLDVDLKSIKIKLDIKKLDLFLSTKKPLTKYQNIYLPINELKIYLDFFSLLTQEPYIKRTKFLFDELNISEVRKLIIRIKPSNFKSFILNNVSGGSIEGSVDLSFLENLELSSYKISGNLKKTNFSSFNNFKIEEASFNFIADSNLILINSISFHLLGIPITNGSISINKKNNILIEGSLVADIDSDTEKLSDLIELIPNLDFSDKKVKIFGNFLNKFTVNLDSTLKLKDYNYDLTGDLKDTKIDFKEEFKSSILKEGIKEIFIGKSNLKANLSKKKENKISIEGVYRLGSDKKYQKYKFDNNFKKSISKFNLDLDLDEHIFIEVLNYDKKKDKVANITAKFDLLNKGINIDNINYIEGKSSISLNKIEISKNNQIKKFKNIRVKTFKNDEENNNFEILFGKKIVIKGKSYDSTNLIKNINKKEKSNFFKGISKEIKISFENIFTKLSIPLNNFNLIGKIYKGKFIKISSKSEFSENRYLDISLKKDPNSNKKILEVYSGFAKPLLADFNFFKGIEGGKLLFVSYFNEKGSSSNLQIKDFKVLNAPAFAKLLALADLTGPAVLLSGEGLNFESLEIKFNDDKKVRTISEIYAVSPSLSILMEGYIENESGLTSLRGTMVPAKEINKIIAKIPVLGDILIGKEMGEGVFGVSFKMKGMPGKVKTTVNPIKTLTPRFITRALEKKKKENNK